MKFLPIDARVSALLDEGVWKTSLVREIFMEHEANSILSIPLSLTLPVDKVVWTAVVNRKFSVKSTYHLGREGVRKNGGESSETSIMQRFWRKIWKAEVPNKVRCFGWRACLNILPTKLNLFHRKVIHDPSCEACGLGPESVLHVLGQCPKAREV